MNKQWRRTTPGLASEPAGEGAFLFLCKDTKARLPGPGMRRITGCRVFPNGGAGIAAWIYLQAQ